MVAVAQYPRLALHVGPHKTASTMLQLALVHNHLSLRRDGALTPPGNSSRYCDGCKAASGIGAALMGPSVSNDAQSRSGWKRLTALRSQALASAQNLVLSSETFDKSTINMSRLVAAVLPFQTTVIIVYRRYHEWAVSMYGQLHQERPPFRKYTGPVSEWAPAHQTVVEFVNTVDGSRKRGLFEANSRAPLAVYRRYASYRAHWNIYVENMHEWARCGPMHAFFCGALAPLHLTATCARHPCDPATNVAANEGHSSVGEWWQTDVAAAAFAAGVLRGNVSMDAVRSVLEPFSDEWRSETPPMQCVGDVTLHRLYETAREAEDELAPDWEPDVALGEAIRRAANTTLCSPDTAQLLRKDEGLQRALEGV